MEVLTVQQLASFPPFNLELNITINYSQSIHFVLLIKTNLNVFFKYGE